MPGLGPGIHELIGLPSSRTRNQPELWVPSGELSSTLRLVHANSWMPGPSLSSGRPAAGPGGPAMTRWSVAASQDTRLAVRCTQLAEVLNYRALRNSACPTGCPSPHRRHHELGPGADAGRPARG